MTVWRAVKVYVAGNLEAAATIIMDGVARYGGADSLMATWARAWLARQDDGPEMQRRPAR
jgi:hypothetical protein